MNVVYEDKITDKILYKIHEAKINDKEIKRIELTPSEWDEFCKQNVHLFKRPFKPEDVTFVSFGGVTVETCESYVGEL